MSRRPVIVTASYWLNRFLFGNRIAQDQDHISQFNTIFAAYVLNALLIGVLLVAGVAVAGFLALTQEPLSFWLGAVIAASNALSLALTYFCSLSWTANRGMVERLRSIEEARGNYQAWVARVVLAIAFFGLTAMSLILVITMFYTLNIGQLDDLGLGNLIASIATNVMLLQGVFARRSLQASYEPLPPGRSAGH